MVGRFQHREIWGLGSGLEVLGFRAQGLGFRICGLGFRVQRLRLRIDLGCLVFNLIDMLGLGFRFGV